jgi:hypothetical protein
MISMAVDWRKSLFWALEVNFVILIIDAILFAIGFVLQSASIIAPLRRDFVIVLLLLESALVFLTGGAVAMSTSIFPTKIREHFFHSKEEWSAEKHKKSEARANLYILVGIFLFVESLGLAFVL